MEPYRLMTLFYPLIVVAFSVLSLPWTNKSIYECFGSILIVYVYQTHSLTELSDGIVAITLLRWLLLLLTSVPYDCGFSSDRESLVHTVGNYTSLGTPIFLAAAVCASLMALLSNFAENGILKYCSPDDFPGRTPEVC